MFRRVLRNVVQFSELGVGDLFLFHKGRSGGILKKVDDDHAEIVHLDNSESAKGAKINFTESNLCTRAYMPKLEDKNE